MLAAVLATAIAACASGGVPGEDAGRARGGNDRTGGSDTERTPRDRPSTDVSPVDAAADAQEDVAAEDIESIDGSGDAADAMSDDAGLDAVVDTAVEDTEPPIPEDCDEVNAVAESTFAPADIIWAIDTSGSMNEEIDVIEENLNAFVSFLEDSGLEDVRVVVIGDPEKICVPEPLSGGGCPDADSERYRHVPRVIASHNAFEVIVDSYPAYSDFLRPDATLHMVVVTDDESDENERWFQNELRNLDPPIGSVTFHSIVSLTEDRSCFLFICETVGCRGPRGDAEAQGAKYMRMSDATGGESFSICEPDWSPIFDAVGASLLRDAAIPCQFVIPDVGEGLDVVYDAVSVFRDGTEIERVDNAGGCVIGEGWYYDDNENPTEIFLCPEACGEETAGSSVDITFGCVKG